MINPKVNCQKVVLGREKRVSAFNYNLSFMFLTDLERPKYDGQFDFNEKEESITRGY